MNGSPVMLSRYLRRALDLLAVENPRAWTDLRGLLCEWDLQIHTESEAFTVHAAGEDVLVARAGGPSHGGVVIQILTTQVGALLEGATTGRQLLESGQARAVGPVDGLIAVAGAFRLLAEAGLRNRSLHRLFEQYRSDLGRRSAAAAAPGAGR